MSTRSNLNNLLKALALALLLVTFGPNLLADSNSGVTAVSGDIVIEPNGTNARGDIVIEPNGTKARGDIVIEPNGVISR